MTSEIFSIVNIAVNETRTWPLHIKEKIILPDILFGVFLFVFTISICIWILKSKDNSKKEYKNRSRKKHYVSKKTASYRPKNDTVFHSDIEYDEDGREILKQRPKITERFYGKAYVTDADGLRVDGQEIRLAGIDSPEWDQPAKGSTGKWYCHGRVVKESLIKKIGGRHCTILAERKDKYGRIIGVVKNERGEDINEWLVARGHARSLYDDRYKQTEIQAKKDHLGMWNNQFNYDPRHWRAKKRKENEC